MQNVYLQRIMKKNAAKSYEKTKPKRTQFPKSQKMNANAFSQKDYENETAFRPQKNKPNQTQFPKSQNELKIACRKIRLTPNPQKYTQDSCVLRTDVVFYSNLRSGM